MPSTIAAESALSSEKATVAENVTVWPGKRFVPGAGAMLARLIESEVDVMGVGVGGGSGAVGELPQPATRTDRATAV